MLNSPHRHTIISGLKDLIDCADQGTEEQNNVLKAIALGIFKIPYETFKGLQAIHQSEVATALEDHHLRRR